MVAKDSSEFAWQQWVTHALGTVIARLPGINVEPTRERIRQVMSYAVERLTDGNIVTFARLLGLSPNTLKNWCQGKRIPEMDMLLRLCYRLDLSLCEVLFQEGETPHPSLREPVPAAIFRSRERMAINKEGVSHQLEQVASRAEDPPPSLKEVSQRLGYQPTTLYKINRAACHAIAERYTAHRRELREKRLQGYREEIRQIALYLQAEQVALTQRHIRRYLAQPAILRDPKVRELLREVCQEVECFDTASPFPPGKETLPLSENQRKKATQQEEGAHPMELPQIVHTYIDAFCRRDAEACLATFAPDGTYSDPATAHQPLSGQAIKDLFGGFFAGFPDAATETVALHAINPDLAVWRWIVRGTHTGSYRGLPPTGRRVIVPGCEFIAVRAGKLQRVEGYFDRLSILEQLGVIPTPGQAS